MLFQANADGERSPEGWAATRIRAALEQLELASRPEIDPGRSARDSSRGGWGAEVDPKDLIEPGEKVQFGES
jgi:hypothetical protein